MISARSYDFMIVPVGSGRPRSFRLSRTTLRVLVAALVVVLALAVFIVVYYGSLVAAAARAERLAAENRSLVEYNKRVRALEAELVRYQEMTEQIARMAGLEREHELIRDEIVRREQIRAEEMRRAGIASEDTALRIVEAPVGSEQRALREFLQRQAAGVRAIPSGWPLRGYVTRGFGAVGLMQAEHTGIDIACAEGTVVRATASGVVLSTGWDEHLGWTIQLDHGNGFRTLYGHLSQVGVSKGDVVEKGRAIGASGNTGSGTTAPHLHYEVIRDGVPVDPSEYMG
jgi:murein DD-endopeptidase MepM/ murein hydrolase activator NlpD